MRPVSRSLVCLLSLLLASGTFVLAQKSDAVTSKNKQITTITTPGSEHTPYVDENAGLTVIYSNLAVDYPNGLYWCCQTATISGPKSLILVEWWHAAAFTPTADATATKIVLPMQYLAGKDTSVILSLNEDNGGIPGTVLEQWNLGKLSEPGICCTILSKAVSGIPLTAGQQYWLVASTSDDSDVWAGWPVADSDQIDSVLNAGYTNQFGTPAWQAYETNINVAFAVYGK
jgi:hypothetical protein